MLKKIYKFQKINWKCDTEKIFVELQKNNKKIFVLSMKIRKEILNNLSNDIWIWTFLPI